MAKNTTTHTIELSKAQLALLWQDLHVTCVGIEDDAINEARAKGRCLAGTGDSRWTEPRREIQTKLHDAYLAAGGTEDELHTFRGADSLFGLGDYAQEAK